MLALRLQVWTAIALVFVYCNDCDVQIEDCRSAWLSEASVHNDTSDRCFAVADYKRCVDGLKKSDACGSTPIDYPDDLKELASNECFADLYNPTDCGYAMEVCETIVQGDLDIAEDDEERCDAVLYFRPCIEYQDCYSDDPDFPLSRVEAKIGQHCASCDEELEECRREWEEESKKAAHDLERCFAARYWENCIDWISSDICDSPSQPDELLKAKRDYC